MFKWRGRGLLLVATVLALGVGTVVATGQAQAGPSAPEDAPALVEEHGDGFAVCAAGGAQEANQFISNDLPTTLGETAVPVPLTNAVVNFNVPVGDTDQIVVTFTAESVLQGQPLSAISPADSIQAQILLNGLPLEPEGPVTLNTDSGQGNAMMVCRRVGHRNGGHTLTVQWQVVDVGMANVLTGTLDDWALNVQVSD